MWKITYSEDQRLLPVVRENNRPTLQKGFIIIIITIIVVVVIVISIIVAVVVLY